MSETIFPGLPTT